MNLTDLIERLDGPSLAETLRFWDEDVGGWPAADRERRERLIDLMLQPTAVAARLDQLSRRLRDVLVQVARSVDWSRPFAIGDLDTQDLELEPFELDAVGAALVRCGFLAPRGEVDGAGRTFVMPTEMGEILGRLVRSGRRPLEAGLSLRAWIRWTDKGRVGQLLEALDIEASAEPGELVPILTVPTCISVRRDAIADPALKEACDVLFRTGGILDGEGRRRIGIDADVATLEKWGRELEELMLGTWQIPDVADHGMLVREGWLVVFREVANAWLRALEVDEDEAEEDLQRSPDALADLQALGEALEKAPLKVKRDGSFYKTAVKRVARRILSPGFRSRSAEEEVEGYLRIFVRREFGTARDGVLALTPKWHSWKRREPMERLKELLEGGLPLSDEGISSFHVRQLRDLALAELERGGIGKWLDASSFSHVVRNTYLARAIRPEHARRYQDQHKHAPFPRLATPGALQRAVLTWLSQVAVILGIIEVAGRGGESRAWALRLTPLGGAMLGLEVEHQSDGGLVVNPDHEVVVFPEDAGFDVVHEVGRFAQRIKADFAVHYSLTRESIQRATADGLDADAILAVLTENSRHSVPQNVEFSIREWCGAVVSLGARRAWILESPDKETLDRLLTRPRVINLVVRRLNDTIAELTDDPAQTGLASDLQEDGVYLG